MAPKSHPPPFRNIQGEITFEFWVGLNKYCSENFAAILRDHARQLLGSCRQVTGLGLSFQLHLPGEISCSVFQAERLDFTRLKPREDITAFQTPKSNLKKKTPMNDLCFWTWGQRTGKEKGVGSRLGCQSHNGPKDDKRHRELSSCPQLAPDMLGSRTRENFPFDTRVLQSEDCLCSCCVQWVTEHL